MAYIVNLKDIKENIFYSLGDNFCGQNSENEEISFNNYYMEKNRTPFFGISGEFHYSRMSDMRWEDELIKMKMAGINVVTTYVFWIHHEEEEGVFDFAGRRNLRKFVELCHKHGLYVILRVGPFAHGEVRNGGFPDWLYGKPFQARTTAPGFMEYVKRLYTKIGEETTGLYFKDNGPIIGVQIDNEYMHSSAPWEITTGISNEWIFPGDEGDTYMMKLKEMAAECGICPAFYTCTAWGGAATPESMLPLWGGYAFRPWLFYSYKGEHPATEEYVYQDFHKNDAECTNDFKPSYKPETRPYACCEMGGGMMCSYYYRFQLPYKSVDAMANIKMGSGCNFLGYYMFQGGSNPIGKHGIFMNEGQVPKISYDYQAALGEYGQIRESYRRLKNIHYFATCFANRLCGLGTVLPEGASQIEATDAQTLRFSVRTDGKSGFIFINNYQDHFEMPDRKEEITLQLENETITYQFNIGKEENAILPFHFNMDGIELIMATAQPLLRIEPEGKVTYVFMVPDGMQARFKFEDGVFINGVKTTEHILEMGRDADIFRVSKDGKEIRVVVIDRNRANEMFKVRGERLIFTDQALLETNQGLKIETTKAQNLYGVLSTEEDTIQWRQAVTEKNEISVECKQVAPNRYVLDFEKDFMKGLKDARLRIDYLGDIGHAFIDGEMIHDHFYNGATWEIGLKDFAEELNERPMTIYIAPLKEGINVNVESGMAARIEEVESSVGEIRKIEVQPVYEIEILKA